MKNIKAIYSFVVLFFLLILTSCTIESDSVPNNLAGMWKLITINDNGKITSYADKQVFWSFQAKLLQLEVKNSNIPKIICYYKIENKVLIITKVYRYDRENGDELLKDPSLLSYYGLTKLKNNFKIELRKDNLNLSIHNKKFSFIRF